MKVKEFLKKKNLREGQVVRVSNGKKELVGTIIPSSSENHLALKLESGYNVELKVSEVKQVEKIAEGKSVGKAIRHKIKRNPALPTISILHTGGTIASRVDYRTGAVITEFSPEDLLSMFPELSDIANFDSKLIYNMFSEDMRFAHYQTIAREIEKELRRGVQGVIVTHGTDTMHYTAAALAFMLENLPIPVILVGSQRSSDRPSNDATVNLICAAEFIKKTDFTGVAICMHENSADDNSLILPATKTRKLHTSRRDAFKPVNDTAIARVKFESREIEFLKKDFEKKGSGKKFRLLDKMEEKVGLLKCHTNMFPEQFEFFKKHKFKGLVLEGTGLGQAPVGNPNKETKVHEKNLKAIKELVESGCVVVMTSQCIFGRVQMHVYANAVDLQKAGVVCGEDMLPETAFVKLAWLLGNFKKEEVKELVGKNLRGEISKGTKMQKITF